MYGAVEKDAKKKDEQLEPQHAKPKLTTNVLRICFFICGVEFCERLSFYTFNGTQAYFLERLNYPLSKATNINASMSTLAFLLTLLTGWFADVPLGRYKTILASALLYIGASGLIGAAAHPNVNNGGLYLAGTMGLVPIATAGIKVCLSLFGADQFDVSTAVGRAAQERFFSWFFAAINAGALIAFGVLVNLGNRGGLGVPTAYGYFAAYIVAGIIMVLALGLFLCGNPTYIITPPPGKSSMTRVMWRLCVAAKQGSKEGALVFIGMLCILVALVLSVAQNGTNGPAITIISAVLAIFGIVTVLCFCPKPDWLDGNSSEAPDKDAKSLLGLIPIVFTGQLGGLMAQTVMQVWFQQQACQMDLRVGNRQLKDGPQLSGAFFNIADCIVIVAGTPIIMHLVNPLIERLFRTRLGYSSKFYIGVFFGNAAMLVAAFLEYGRRAAPTIGVVSACAPKGIEMKALNAAWLVIPYVLTGISEVYVFPSIMYIAYDKSPESMRTFASIIVMFVLSVISCIVSLVNRIMGKYITDNLDQGKLEYVYYVNIGVSLVFTFLFWRANRVFQESEAEKVKNKEDVKLDYENR